MTIDHVRGPEFFAAGEPLWVMGYGRLDVTSVTGLAVAALRRAGASFDEFDVVTGEREAEGRLGLPGRGLELDFAVRTRPYLAAGARLAVSTGIRLRGVKAG